MINLSPEAIDLARRLAAAQSLSVEEAIVRALEVRARAAGILAEPPGRRDPSPGAIAARQASLDRIAAEIAAMPILDARSAREIMDELNTL